ncbi:hypothetical protein ASPVEDRAFT_134247 [Aspergillus versicolor CBS 583.65]|uniref:Kelch repeat protein n=1 Tax=Aspergillus versicolor CBS 583.65 TaxID=1036611 RepID=A0A1L9PNQ7_ASPVE|nr:uncharacterized protein ASPVEDRAFT_134247 [Aspergillus versicolor CBS 583.65]OJJ03076.1 hypothetical protein ASPVEDRAFT_134247 [Aspergillus versicolor CBS 583.65]
MLPDRWRLAVLAAFVGLSQAQLVQNGTAICSWGQLRANILRDTVYLDGGTLWEDITFGNGDRTVDQDENPGSITHYLNLSSTFNTKTDNLTALFGELDKTGGMTGSNLAPNYNDGVMFANDGIFILYGGYLPLSDSASYPSPDQAIAYREYEYGIQTDDFSPSIQSVKLTDDVTWHITNGAGVTSPSENLGFYMSGVHAPGWAETLTDGNLRNLSQQMITVDMSEMQRPVFSNVSIPSYVKPRANAEAVWLPVADRGIVVLIGGVTYPEQLYSSGLSDSQIEESMSNDPELMQTVAIYDIAGDEWYVQETAGDHPPQLQSFCSVYASASDSSSHNIYIYGGYEGVSPKNDTMDDVYVLSLPSFEWIKLYEGDVQTGRKQHKCVKPYPDKMLVLGGSKVGPKSCLDPIRVYNLNTGRFQDTYNPEDWEEYKVPDLVSGRIGGNADGGATKTEPESWTNSSLADVFGTTYSKTIETYYPYESSATPTTTTVPSGGGGGFPGWAGAIIGVVLGVLLIAGALAFFFIRRRRKRGARRQSEVSGITSRVANWVNAGAFGPTSKDPENSTIVSGDITSGSTAVGPESSIIAPPPPMSQATQEVAGDPVYEMHGTSTPGQQAAFAVELPTPFNQDTANPGSPSGTLPVGFTSPVSPEIPQEKDGDETSRPGHQRNVSSLSSAPSYDPALGDESDSVAQRPRYVSGISEASVSSAGTRADGTGTALSNRGLGLEDIPDEDHRER